MSNEAQILQGLTPTKVIGRGRPKGSGCNLRVLELLKPGDSSSCIFGVSEKKMRSIRTTASQHKMKVKIRMLEGKQYAIWRL